MQNDEEEEDTDIKFRKSDEIISKSNQGSIPKVCIYKHLIN